MKRLWSGAWVLAACSMAIVPAAYAQSAGPSAAPVVRHSAGGIGYISGGAGEEDRTTMAARAQEFPFKVVLSGTGGEYIAAETFTVSSPQGEVLSVRDAGPIVMMNLPAGQYTLEASWKGKSERRSVEVGGAAQTVNWRFPG